MMVIRDVIQGRNGGQKFRNLLSKKMTKGEGGGQKIGKMGQHCLWMSPKVFNDLHKAAFNETLSSDISS